MDGKMPVTHRYRPRIIPEHFAFKRRRYRQTSPFIFALSLCCEQSGFLARVMVKEVKIVPKHTQPECHVQASEAPALRSSEFLEHAMRTWGDMVLRLALSQLRNATDAEDVFQDAFLRLLKDTTPFNDDEHVKAWLLRVTINRCRDVGRSRSKRRNEPLTDVHASIEAPDLFTSDVWEAVGELAFDLRLVVHLFYVEGYKTDEIALIANCPAATVRTRLHRARACLKDALGATRPTTERPGGRPGGRRAQHSEHHADSPHDQNFLPNQPLPFGKEAPHEQRPPGVLRFEDAGSESV